MEKIHLTDHVVDLDLGLSSVTDCLTATLSTAAWNIAQYCSKTTWDVLMVALLEAGLQLMIYIIKKNQLVSDYSEPYAFKIPMDDISGSFDPLQQRNTRSQPVPEYHVTGSTKPDEGKNARNKVVQTIGPWQKRIRSQQRHFMELTSSLDQKVREFKKNRKELLQKGKLRFENLTNEYEGKLKLIAGVKTSLVHLGADISTLIRKIKDGRQQLEVRRQQNKQEIQRYEQLQRTIEGHLQHVTNPESSDVYIQEHRVDLYPDVY